MKKLAFDELARQWKEDTQFLSNVGAIIDHPAYEHIISLGEEMVPYIIQDMLENGPNHWFNALSRITGANPITKDIVGNLDKMADAWITWYNNRL